MKLKLGSAALITAIWSLSSPAQAGVKSFLMSCPSFDIVSALVNDSATDAAIRKADAISSLIPTLAFRRQQNVATRGIVLDTSYGFQGQIRNPIRLWNEFSIASNQSLSVESYGRKAKLETVMQLIQSYYEWKHYSEYAKVLESWKPYFDRRSGIDMDQASPGMIQTAVEAVAMVHELTELKSRLQSFEDEFKKCKMPIEDYAFPTISKDVLTKLANEPSPVLAEQEKICGYESKVRDSQVAVAKSGWIPEFRYSYFKTLQSNGTLAMDSDWSVGVFFTIPLSLFAGSSSSYTRCDVELSKARLAELNRDGDVVADYTSVGQLQVARGRMIKLIQMVRPEAEVGVIKTDRLVILFKQYKTLVDQLVRAQVNVMKKAWEVVE